MNPIKETISFKEQANSLSLTDLLCIIRRNWYWFVLSVIVCSMLALVYLKWAPKVYIRTATILIKDNGKGGGISESAAFEELNMFNIKSNVDNEVLVLKSKQLMSAVVERLSLDVSYATKDGLRTIEQYTRSPVKLLFPDAVKSQSFSLVATPLSKEEVLLSDFSEEEGIVKKVVLNDTVVTPIGKVVVIPTLYYTDRCLGNPVTVSKNNRSGVVMSYSNALQVALASKTATIINLTLRDASIPRAEDVINTLIAIYNEEAINDKNQVTVNTSDFIADRLIIIEKELGRVDTDIESYKRENQLTDIHSETGMYLQESSQNSQEGLGLENKITLARYIREYLTDPLKSTDLIPSNTGISDVNIEGQISEYNNLLLKRDKFISNSSDKNPVVMDLNNSLNAMKQTIVRAIDNLIVGLNIKIKNIQAREVQNTRRISAVPTQQKYVLSVERQQKIKEELYLYLLNKREENALSQAITESNARIIDAATGSNNPIAPKSMFVIFVAMILGFVIPGGVLWLKEVLNTTIWSRKEVEDAVSIPFLGEIPLRDKKDKNEIVIQEGSRNSISEAFRIVRANTDFMRVKSSNMKVVMFTSFNPGAGKTFVSMNLAMSIALTGKKVIIIDLDIRKGTLSSHVSQTNMGITHYLSGETNQMDDVISKGELHQNLDIIHTGAVPPNPSELLLSDRLELLIDELKKSYDYIILDNVPAGIVADATIVNRVADLTVYILRAGKFDRRQFPDLEKMYRQDKFHNMCLILNGVKYKHGGYGYGYGYSYGYGYGYGNK